MEHLRYKKNKPELVGYESKCLGNVEHDRHEWEVIFAMRPSEFISVDVLSKREYLILSCSFCSQRTRSREPLIIT